MLTRHIALTDGPSRRRPRVSPSLPLGKERTRLRPCGLRGGGHCEGQHGGRGGGDREDAGEEEAAETPGTTWDRGLAAFPRPSARLGDRGGAGATAPDRAHDAAARTSCHYQSMLRRNISSTP